MAKCKECGYELQGNEKACPNCGCPTENADAAAYMDSEVLNEGKSTDAEAVVSNMANTVLWWGKILSIIIPILTLFGSFGGGISIMANEEDYIGGSLMILVCIVYAIILFYLIKFIAKLIWGVIMLFVNMSTTLKRIEILNEKK